MLKLGANDLNKGYLGGTEINKAYLGNTLIFGGGSVAQYLLNLGGNVQQDHLSIPQSEKAYQVPASGDFEFGVTLEKPTSTAISGLIGYNVTSGSVTDRWGLYSDGNSLLFVTKEGTIGVSLSSLPDSVFSAKCGWYDDGQGGTDSRMYIDNIIVAESLGVSRPTALDAQRVMFIGAYGDGTGSLPNSSFYLEGKIHSFFIDDDVFEVNEGAGFNTVSILGTTAYGSTSNAGSLTYWNSTVWQVEV